MLYTHILYTHIYYIYIIYHEIRAEEKLLFWRNLEFIFSASSAVHSSVCMFYTKTIGKISGSWNCKVSHFWFLRFRFYELMLTIFSSELNLNKALLS